MSKISKTHSHFALLIGAALAFGTSAPAWATTHAKVTLANPTAKDSATPQAGPPPTPNSPIADKNTPPPPSLPGFTAYVLMNAETGAVLAEAAPDLKLPPASLTKLMTAHLTYQALRQGTLKMDQTVPVSIAAWKAGGSRMFLAPNATVTVNQLLHGLIIDSGNDAAVALAQQIAGSQQVFVSMMNREARKLGLTDTHYTDVTGLPDPGLYTSAMDVAKLTRVILQDEPQILQISKEKSYTFDNITQASWNPVLQHDPTVDGLKTGLTNESGHCIDATAVRNGERLIAVVMGGPTWQAATAAVETLLDYGQRFFTDVTVATGGQPIDTLKSPYLQQGSVPVGPGQTLVMTLPQDAQKQITHSVSYSGDVQNGVTKGEKLGVITYTLDGKTIATVPAVALADAPQASQFTRWERKLHTML